MDAKVFGGGAVMRNFTKMNIGERNAQFVLQFLATEGIRVVSQDLMDVHPRRVAFFPTTGRALCKKLTTGDASIAAEEQRYNSRITQDKAATSGDVELF